MDERKRDRRAGARGKRIVLVRSVRFRAEHRDKRQSRPDELTESPVASTPASPHTPAPNHVSFLKSVSTTAVPAVAKACAVASPMPDAAPVTSATLPLKLKVMLVFYSLAKSE